MAAGKGDNVHDTVEKAEFLQLHAAHIQAEIELEEIAAQKKAIRKRMRGAGIVMNDYDEWRKELDMELDELKAKFGRKKQYSSHLGHQSQMAFDLGEQFSSDEMSRAYDVGVQCALARKSTDENPFAPSVPQHQKWLEGWTEGNAIVDAAPKPESFLIKKDEDKGNGKEGDPGEIGPDKEAKKPKAEKPAKKKSDPKPEPEPTPEPEREPEPRPAPPSEAMKEETTGDEDNQAYGAGWAAAEAGLGKDLNPFTEGDPRRGFWAEGFNAWHTSATE